MKFPRIPSHVQDAIDEQLVFKWNWKDDPDELRAKLDAEHRRTSQTQLRKIALDGARVGLGAYVGTPFMRFGDRDQLQHTYDLVDPESEPEMAASLKRLQYVRDRVSEFGAEGLARAVVDVWRESDAPCRDLGVPSQTLMKRLLIGTGAQDPKSAKKTAALNLTLACGAMPSFESEVTGNAMGSWVTEFLSHKYPLDNYFSKSDAPDEDTLIVLLKLADSKDGCGFEWELVDDFPPATEDTEAGHVYTSRGCEPVTAAAANRWRSSDDTEYVYYEAEDGTWTRQDVYAFIRQIMSDSEATKYLGYDRRDKLNEEFWSAPQELFFVTSAEEAQHILEDGFQDERSVYADIDYTTHGVEQRLLKINTRRMWLDFDAAKSTPGSVGDRLYPARVDHDESTIDYQTRRDLGYELGVSNYDEGNSGDNSDIFFISHVPSKYISIEGDDDADGEELRVGIDDGRNPYLSHRTTES